VLVVCSFDVPFGVFAFDDAGVASGSSGGVQACGEPACEGEPAAVGCVRVVRGKSRLGGRWIDRHYGTSPWGLLGGVLISIILTSVMLVQKFAKMVKDIETSSLPPNTPKPE
jgi:hypothetical protein